ncbi:MAG TPA: copper homeostasis membrane protein CopD [Paenirhodobacter sp.]
MGAAEILLIGCRCVVFAAALMLFGAALFRWRLMPDTPPLHGHTGMIAALIAAIALTLPARIAQMTDGWGSVADPGMIGLVLIGTGAGHGWTVQAVAVIVLAIAARRDARMVVTLAAGVILAAQALSGHAAATPGWIGVLRQANDVLHMLAAGAWLGALPLVLRLLPRIGQDNTHHLLIRYSRQGHVWVALVLVTGMIATLTTVEGIPVDWSKRYQVLLCLKIAVTAAMVGLAIRNRYILVPRFSADIRARRALTRATRGEIVLGFVAVALVAWFGMLDPA